MRRLLVTSLLLVACATPLPPATYDFQNSFTVQATEDDTWTALISVFGERRWTITNMERASGFISTEWLRAEAGMLDCGTDALGNSGVGANPQVMFNVVVTETDVGETKVAVNASMRTNSMAGTWLPCNSTGVVEALVMNDVLERLDSGGW